MYIYILCIYIYVMHIIYIYIVIYILHIYIILLCMYIYTLCVIQSRRYGHSGCPLLCAPAKYNIIYIY